MRKSQKKNSALDTKPQVTRKSGKSKPEAISKQLEKTSRHSKRAKIIAMLQRPDGATIDEMAKATGWQRHSVYGMMSGTLKKRLGLSITSDMKERGRAYRITGSVSRS